MAKPMTREGKGPSPAGGSRGHWMRGLYMLLFLVIYNVAEALAVLVAVFQLGHTVVTGTTNHRLQDLGHHVSAYIYEIMRYLTYCTEDRPYPFNPWPERRHPDR